MATTETENPYNDIHCSQEVADKFELQPHLVGMLLTEPFFAEIIRTITKSGTRRFRPPVSVSRIRISTSTGIRSSWATSTRPRSSAF